MQVLEDATAQKAVELDQRFSPTFAAWLMRKRRGNGKFFGGIDFKKTNTMVQEIPLLFAAWPGYVLEEPSQRKQPSIMFKLNFRAAAPAPPGAAPQSTPWESRAFGSVSAQAPPCQPLIPLHNKYQLILFMRAKER